MGLADEIGKAFSPLVGVRLSLARYSGMTVFHFGDVQPAAGGGTVGQFALHIQCPWRIVTPEQIITGSSDHWYPADENLDWTEWEKDRSTPSLQEKCLLDLFLGYDPESGACENITGRLVVEAVTADTYGGAAIQLTGGYALQLFPAGELPDSEHWRLFQPGSDAEHFVVKGKGILERVGPSSDACK